MAGRRVPVSKLDARELGVIARRDAKATAEALAAREQLALRLTHFHDLGYSIRALAEAVERTPSAVYSLIQEATK